MGYLRTGKALIESINETIELVELNALGQMHLLDAHTSGKMFEGAAIAVKYGTKKWAEKTVEEILSELPFAVIQEIGEKVAALSGLDEDVSKKSESNRAKDSSSV